MSFVGSSISVRTPYYSPFLQDILPRHAPAGTAHAARAARVGTRTRCLDDGAARTPARACNTQAGRGRHGATPSLICRAHFSSLPSYSVRCTISSAFCAGLRFRRRAERVAQTRPDGGATTPGAFRRSSSLSACLLDNSAIPFMLRSIYRHLLTVPSGSPASAWDHLMLRSVPPALGCHVYLFWFMTASAVCAFSPADSCLPATRTVVKLRCCDIAFLLPAGEEEGFLDYISGLRHRLFTYPSPARHLARSPPIYWALLQSTCSRITLLLSPSLSAGLPRR